MFRCFLDCALNLGAKRQRRRILTVARQDFVDEAESGRVIAPAEPLGGSSQRRVHLLPRDFCLSTRLFGGALRLQAFCGGFREWLQPRHVRRQRPQLLDRFQCLLEPLLIDGRLRRGHQVSNALLAGSAFGFDPGSRFLFLSDAPDFLGLCLQRPNRCRYSVVSGLELTQIRDGALMVTAREIFLSVLDGRARQPVEFFLPTHALQPLAQRAELCRRLEAIFGRIELGAREVELVARQVFFDRLLRRRDLAAPLLGFERVEIRLPLVQQTPCFGVAGIPPEDVVEDFDRGVVGRRGLGGGDHVFDLPLPFPFLGRLPLGLFLPLDRLLDLLMQELGSRVIGIQPEKDVSDDDRLGQVTFRQVPRRLVQMVVDFLTLLGLGFERRLAGFGA